MRVKIRRRRATPRGEANPPSPLGCGGKPPSPTSLLLGVSLWIRRRCRSLDPAAWRSQRGSRGVLKPALIPMCVRIWFLGLMIVAGALWRSPNVAMGEQTSASSPSDILVDDFETGETQGLFAERKNRLDAFQGTWAKRPSYTIITKVPDTRPGNKGKSLRIEYSKQGGWCGWYTLLNGVDVSKHNALTFWVKGEQGGERFDIGFADDRMQDLQIDAVYAGPISAFLPDGVTTEWQLVKVPLAGLRSDIDVKRMGSLIFWFRYEGKGAIQVDDVKFVYDKEIEKILEANVPRAKPDPRAPRASWVWKYDPLNSLGIRKELLEFCERAAINMLFVYLGEDPIQKTPADYQQKLADFLREAHARGVQVEALQGNPLWALKPNHPLVLDWVGGYLEFNKKRPKEEKIDGVSLDIEPYLTSEWESGDRDKLKSEFLELLAQLRKLVDTQRGDSEFHFGVAIPVFYNREPEFEENLLRHVDYAALMDYYDTASDIVDNGRFHIDLAGKVGTKIVVGVETQDLVQMAQGKRRNTFHEEGWEDMENQLAKVVDAFASQPGFGGLAIHCYDSYRLLQRGRNVPTKDRSGKIPPLVATRVTDPVTIDGDLKEWSKVTWVNLNQRSQVVYGPGAWGGAHDASFKIAFQWQPDALLMALDVTDDKLVQESQGANMWEGDHAEVWMDTDLFGDYNEAVNSSDDFQFGISPGNFKNLPPEVYVWTPTVDPKSLKQIQIASQKKEFGYTIEVRFPTKFLFQTLQKRVGVEPTGLPGKMSGKISPETAALQNGVLSSGQFKAGFKMGVMVDGSDTDDPRQPQKCLLSTSPERQWGDPTTFNIMELK